MMIVPKPPPGTITVNVTVPSRQPFEGNATQRQKHKIWEMGYRDEAVIASLGKAQASSIIDQLEKAATGHQARKSGLFKLKLAGIGALIWGGLMLSARLDWIDAESGLLIFFIIFFPVLVIYWLISGLFSVAQGL